MRLILTPTTGPCPSYPLPQPYKTHGVSFEQPDEHQLGNALCPLFWSKISWSKKHLTSRLPLCSMEAVQHHKQQARGHQFGDETHQTFPMRKHLTPGVLSLVLISSLWQVPLVCPRSHQIRRGIRGVVKMVVRETGAATSSSGRDYFLSSNLGA